MSSEDEDYRRRRAAYYAQSPDTRRRRVNTQADQSSEPPDLSSDRSSYRQGTSPQTLGSGDNVTGERPRGYVPGVDSTPEPTHGGGGRGHYDLRDARGFPSSPPVPQQPLRTPSPQMTRGHQYPPQTPVRRTAPRPGSRDSVDTTSTLSPSDRAALTRQAYEQSVAALTRDEQSQMRAAAGAGDQDTVRNWLSVGARRRASQSGSRS
jgi:hypothetical protein